MLVSLVLPCYMPQKGWDVLVAESWRELCRRIDEDVEVVLVLDGRCEQVTDNVISGLYQQITSLIVLRYADNKGKGYAIRQGVAQAKGDIILYTDIDFPYTMDSICEVYSSLKENVCDVAVGVKNDDYYKRVPPMRRRISKMLRTVNKLLLSMPITDTQCGLKGFRREVKHTFTRTKINRYLFDLEFIHTCFREKVYRVRPVPIALKEGVQFRKMNFRVIIPELVNFVRLLIK